MNIGLIPLDERPVNVRYPRMLADIAGARLFLPPPDALSQWRTPADLAKLEAWLMETAPQLDVLIVSVEMLAYGGLIASRITDEQAVTVLNRLDALRALKTAYPALRIFGFNVITRISNANDAVEEPEYWAEYGARLYAYSQQGHRARLGIDTPPALADIPAAYVQDFTARRLRNHQVNLATLGLLGDGVFDTLVLSADDSSPYGFGSEEGAWLRVWQDRLQTAQPEAALPLLMYPGADEVGCVLLARALLTDAAPPRVAVRYAIPADAERVAPYENAPVRETIARQIEAVGAVEVATLDEAELILAVNPPSPCACEREAVGTQGEPERAAPLATFADDIAGWVSAGRAVMVADVAYPNGSDPVLSLALRTRDLPPMLAAYGAWNTAGNTIGTVLAQGILGGMAHTPEQQRAAERFMAHRWLEDDAYQGRVRALLRGRLLAETGHHDPAPEMVETVRAWAEAALRDELAALAFSGWALENVRLPWGRTFEVDFELVEAAP